MGFLRKIKDIILRKELFKTNVVLENTELKSNKSQEPEKTFEEMYEGKSDSEIWDAIIEKDEDEWTSEESSFNLSMIFYHEHKYGRSLAIKLLVNNEYKILPDEHGNSFKELINFTLLYFSNGKFTDGDELKKNIQFYFPIMYKYIIRQVKLINPNLSLTYDNIDNANLIDEQTAYHEFVNFVFVFFTKAFNDKDLRDNAIRNNFSIKADSLISFIETKIKDDAENSV